MNHRRTHRSPTPITIPSRRHARGTPLLACAMAALSLLAAPARAALVGIETRPAEPTVCDSVTMIVAGLLPDDCHTVLGMRVGEPEELPTAGPIPTYRIRARVRVVDHGSELGMACVLVTKPYKLEASLGNLRFGNYLVEATEYTYVSRAETDTPRDSSRIVFSFFVGADTCRVVDGCVLLGFAPPTLDGWGADGCTVRTSAGGRTCLSVTMQNPVPVGALQTEIVIPQPPRDGSTPEFFEPYRVEATPRAAGFEAAWTADGSTVKVVLYSPTGATIAPGRGAVLHVCYGVREGTPAGAYPIHFEQPLVADPEGHAISFCPTFARIEGRICVGDPPPCDVNDDGRSDIRDVLRLVRCILADPGGSDACPEDVRTRADCNRDGDVNVQDLLCCIRRILAHDGSWNGPAPMDGGDATNPPARIGFDGDVRWTSPYEGTATLRIEPTAGFGGLQWVVDPGTAARIHDVALDDPDGGYGLAWTANPDGSARVMLYDRGLTRGGAASGGTNLEATEARAVRVVVEPAAGADAGGALMLRDVRAASWDAAAFAVETGAVRSAIPANAATTAPAVFPARPNPFVTATDIAYAVPTSGSVSLRLFDVRGRLVRTLVSGTVRAGAHHVSWDGRDDDGMETGSGVYFIRFDAEGVSRTQRLVRFR